MTSGLKKPNNPSSPAGAGALLSNVLVVINPTSGTTRRRNKLKIILEKLQADAGRIEIVYTAAVLDATRLIKEKRGMGFSLIICAGGDGTINEVINGFLEAEGPPAKGSLPIPPLAILPTGTGNGLAREIGLPLDPLSAYQAILAGAPRPVYPGKLTNDADRVSPPRYFILFVGAGFDGYVITWIDRRKGLFKKFPKLSIYFLFGFAGLFSYSYPTVEFSVDGVPCRGSTGLVTKAKLVLGPWTIAPSAGIGKPSLVLCLFKSKGLIGYLKTLVGFLLYRDAAKGIEYIEGKEIKISGTKHFVHADGESLGKIEARLSISDKPLFLVFPGPPAD